MRRANGGQSIEVKRRRQRDVVCDVMLCAAECHSWLTLRELSRLTGYGEASVSAQLRHLRKPECGAFLIDKRCRRGRIAGRGAGHGAVWEYRLRRRGRTPATRPTWATPAVMLGVVRAARQVVDADRRVPF